ncbi:MAG: TIGR02757 family protein [Muribaculaceae bacterium]|nr:TIGR02757 family protein [Muribaculaceae bacterium]
MPENVSIQLKALLTQYAQQYETREFLVGDPSWFMHQVSGNDNQEAMALIASALSYGKRSQFMQKIEWIAQCAQGKIDKWVRNGEFANHLPCGSKACFYRLYNVGQMHNFLQSFRLLLDQWGTLGNYVEHNATTGFEAIDAICQFFAKNGNSGIIPKDTQSACKRVCMMLRWLVRDNSPVDIGLWARFIPKTTLIMPLDTHVVTQSHRLGLIGSKTASMSTAIKLTSTLATVFPDDPLKGDFALFGYGVNN